ncbi:MAG: PBSX family phage terminase large subunit [Pseudomonadota bacterium]|nr:PBSX family phage terminase large subunit [Pseudomonadota bacterium]
MQARDPNNINIELLEPICWLLSKPKRFKVAVGGRGSGKSIGVADVMIMCAAMGQRIIGLREFQNSISDSVHQAMKDEIDRMGIGGFNSLATEIKHLSGGSVIYRGLARNTGGIKSLSKIDKAWIEEGQYISEESWNILTPTIRSGAGDKKIITINGEQFDDIPEIWITMNRGSSEDAIAKHLLERAEDSLARTGRYEDDICMIVEMNYDDNPYFPDELEMQRQDDYQKLSRAMYDHIWNGHYLDDIEDSIIKTEWFDAAIDAHKKLGIKPTGVRVLSFDPADTGDDAKAIAERHGILIKHIEDKNSGNLQDGSDWAVDEALQRNVDAFVYDGDGLGVGIRRDVEKGLSDTKINIEMYKGSEGVYQPEKTVHGDRKNKDTYFNLRAQAIFALAKRFEQTYKAVEFGDYIQPDELISISGDIKCLKRLRAETCRIPSVPNGAGKLQVMSKQKMKSKLNINSPNMFDALTMAMWYTPDLKREKKRRQRKNTLGNQGWMA